jgi:hypothetical protein
LNFKAPVKDFGTAITKPIENKNAVPLYFGLWLRMNENGLQKAKTRIEQQKLRPKLV